MHSMMAGAQHVVGLLRYQLPAAGDVSVLANCFKVIAAQLLALGQRGGD
jgi:hypothetical protein